jgi:uncharacterized protein (TIGR03067 family)
LHQVAYRICLRLRKRDFLKRTSERAAAREGVMPAAADVNDLRPILDAEIERLPQRFRSAFLLCHFEGKTNEEAAGLLGVPKGTLLSRLARARQRLKRRLIQRGIAPAACGIALSASTDPVSAALVNTTVHSIHGVAQSSAATPSAIAALAEGAMREMFWNKIKLMACVILAVSFLGVGSVLIGWPGALAEADKPAKTAEKPEPKTNVRDDKLAGPTVSDPTPLDLLLPRRPLPSIHKDEYRIHGTWTVVAVIADGERRDPGDLQIAFGPFQTMLVQDPSLPRNPNSLSFKLDPDQKPPAIDLTVGGKAQVGIYKIFRFGGAGTPETDGLILCLTDKGNKRPIDFNCDKGSGNVYFELWRKAYSAETNWAEKLFPDGLVVDFGSVFEKEPKTVHVKVKNPYPLAVWFSSVGDGGEPWLTQRIPATGPIEPGGEIMIELTPDLGKLKRMAATPVRGMASSFAQRIFLYSFSVKNYRPKTDPLSAKEDPSGYQNGGQPRSNVVLTIKADFNKSVLK